MKNYTTNEIFETLQNRANAIFDNLSEKDFVFLCYLLRPNSTAIGASREYNRQTIDDFIFTRCNDIAENTRGEANREYTLNKVIERINAGTI